MADDDVQNLAHEILKDEPAPVPVKPSDEPNPAVGFLGLLLHPLTRLFRRPS